MMLTALCFQSPLKEIGIEDFWTLLIISGIVFLITLSRE